MKRRDFLKTAALGMSLLPMTTLAQASEAKTKPNILIYIADDQYLASVGCYGANPSHTPNIDRFAQEGLLFKKAFCTSSMCTPNRAVLLSGLYPIKGAFQVCRSGDIKLAV